MKRASVAALLVLIAIPLLAAMAELPPHGSSETPAYTHVSERYLQRGAQEAGAENIVTDVILNYRGFDTNGEVTVIFTSVVAVAAILLLRDEERTSQERSSTPVSPVLLFIVRTMAPFIALFGMYVILFGHLSPGGGFQGGTILGALVIVSTVVLGPDVAHRMVPAPARPWLQAAAPLTFVTVGLAGLAVTGHYLGFPSGDEWGWVGTLMLVVIEIGIGVGGGTIMASIFWMMEEER
ncbi:MAG: hydrogen gas-evolving membrane-bound hydrogenase subunit E [Coriobacteriales bacterium]|nr:sodium:proton antiporter [Actinomycetes bacterium]